MRSKVEIDFFPHFPKAIVVCKKLFTISSLEIGFIPNICFQCQEYSSVAQTLPGKHWCYEFNPWYQKKFPNCFQIPLQCNCGPLLSGILKITKFHALLPAESSLRGCPASACQLLWRQVPLNLNSQCGSRDEGFREVGNHCGCPVK